MKRLIITSAIGTVVVLSLLLLVSGCCGKCRRMAGCPDGKCGAGPVAAKMEAVKAVISTEALQVLLQSPAPVTVLDARTGKFDDGKRIPGAKSLSPDADKAVMEAMLPSKDALIVTYCSNLQCPASGLLAGRLHELGFKNVLEYSEGIAGWIEAGHAVETVK